MIICPECGSHLEFGDAAVLSCTCGVRYPRLPSGGIDFLQGLEYPDFDLNENDLVQQSVLEQESVGVNDRMERFLIPLIRRYARTSGKLLNHLAVLDCGCGAGLSVDLLHAHDINAWGIDSGAARHRQWLGRQAPGRLFSANALHLPFADASFDVVLSCGLVEHIGIHEEERDGYRSHRLHDCDKQRSQFIRELTRVLKGDGFILLDHPNGAFPADFWHGGTSGSIRWHRLHGDMLPRFSEIAAYFRAADAFLTLTPMSPSRRLTFNKVGVHWYGRVFAPAMKSWLRLMDFRLFSFLARSCLNPYLVTIAARSLDTRWIIQRKSMDTHFL
jgi:SAM-dependent methyltransferase